MLQILRQGLVRNWIGVLTCLVLGAMLFGLGYWAGQRSVKQSTNTLASQAIPRPYTPGNPVPGANGMRPMLPPGAPQVPPNATPEMKEFLENRAKLMASMTQLRQANAANPSDPKIMAQFQEQNKDLLARQRELAQKVYDQQMKNPLPEPPPLQIPPNATPQQKAYLTDRDALMRDQVAFMNQHRTDEPAKRQAEMQQWHQQNAARFQQLQQEVQALAQNNVPANPSNNSPNPTTTK